MLVVGSLLLFFCQVFASDLCKNNSSWYNTNDGICAPCKVCGPKSLELAPCSEFRNTMCVDLVAISPKFNRKLTIKPKWHEMEGNDDHMLIVEHIEEKQLASATKAISEIHQEWGLAIVIALCAALVTFLGITAVIFGYSKRFSSCSENRKVLGRARLFSRDRLNTTDYMQNLASLDRRLAMDEILEKRKKAIFEPQLLNENFYTDEVFVDISGIPHYQDDHEYEELDNRKSLLDMQNRQ